MNPETFNWYFLFINSLCTSIKFYVCSYIVALKYGNHHPSSVHGLVTILTRVDRLNACISIFKLVFGIKKNRI